jgi:DNA helicase-2/ATP-dependent DNA helicase PcrA
MFIYTCCCAEAEKKIENTIGSRIKFPKLAGLKSPLEIPGFLNDLNPEQREAALAVDGPVMILAGAGSGKTRVLTYRIAYLLHRGTDAFHILALTFTNKAAREMKERISKLVGEQESRNLWMGTFHSVFARLLRSEAHRIGFPSSFTIYDTDDSRSLIKSIVKELNLDDKVYKPSMVHSRISSAKNNLLTWQAYRDNAEIQADDRASRRPEITRIFELYHLRCFQSNAMDFDDLLFYTNILLRDFPDVLHKYQHKFKFILVDEYQDTNFAQYVIVKKLAAAFENICVVGDDAQSIYGFRGANIQNILNFQHDYPGMRTFKLEQNYRSTKTIVEAANKVINNNQEQFEKQVWTHNEAGQKIPVLRALTDNEEGWMVANAIFEIRMNEQAANKDFSILYRTNAQSRALEEALRKLNIPYKIYGGLSFYKRKEIKDLVAYFRLVINPHDEEAFKRIINYPARGIGQTTLDKIGVEAATRGMSLWQVCLELYERNPMQLQAGTRQKLLDFCTMIQHFSLRMPHMDAYELGAEIAAASGILKELYADKTPEGVSRYENIQALLNGMKDFTENKTLRISPPDAMFVEGEFEKEEVADTLDVFMQDIALLTDAEEEGPEKDHADKVSLMTVHAAKGLEFPYVFVVGLEENLFPAQQSMGSRSELEEERRLFYVAITRARKRVTLSYAQSRYKYGNLLSCDPSRFIDEIDEELLIRPRKVSAPKTAETPWGGKPFFLRKTSQELPAASKRETPPATAGRGKLRKIEEDRTRAGEGEVTGDFVIGQRVEHGTFGVGTIQALEGAGANRKASILFDSGQSKQLLLTFAKLKAIE